MKVKTEGNTIKIKGNGLTVLYTNVAIDRALNDYYDKLTILNLRSSQN